MVRWEDHVSVRLLKADRTPRLLVVDNTVQYAVALPGEVRMLLLSRFQALCWLERACSLVLHTAG